jgi:hypothetical protein
MSLQSRFLDRGMPPSWQIGTDPSAPLRRHPDHPPARGRRCDSQQSKSAPPLPHEPAVNASRSKTPPRFALPLVSSIASYDPCSPGLREEPDVQRTRTTAHHPNPIPLPQPPNTEPDPPPLHSSLPPPSSSGGSPLSRTSHSVAPLKGNPSLPTPRPLPSPPNNALEHLHDPRASSAGENKGEDPPPTGSQSTAPPSKPITSSLFLAAPSAAMRLEQALPLCLHQEQRAQYPKFISWPLPSHTYEDISSYNYEELVSLALYHTPRVWEAMAMSEEELCVHVLSLRAEWLEFDAAEAAAASKSSGGEDDPTTNHTKAEVQCTSAWSCTAPAEPPFNKDLSPQAFKSDASSVAVPPPTYWISLGRPPPAPNWLLHFGTAHLPRPPPAPNWYLWTHPLQHQLLEIPLIPLRRGKHIGEAVGFMLGMCCRLHWVSSSTWPQQPTNLLGVPGSFTSQFCGWNSFGMQYFLLWEQYTLLWNFGVILSMLRFYWSIGFVLWRHNTLDIPGFRFSCTFQLFFDCNLLRSLKRGGVTGIYDWGQSGVPLCVVVYPNH